MNRLVKALADESKYFHIFLGVLSLYALIGTILFGVCVNYAPNAAGSVATVFLLGAVLVAIGARVIHNLCYAKVMNDEQLEKFTTKS